MKALEQRPSCESGLVEYPSPKALYFKYGVEPNTVTLTAMVRTLYCHSCTGTFGDVDAEEKIQESIGAYLAGKN